MKLRDHILYADGVLLGGLLALFSLQEPYPSPGLAAFAGALALAALLGWLVAQSRPIPKWARAALLLWELVATFLAFLAMLTPLMFGWDGPPLSETAATLHWVGAGGTVVNLAILLGLIPGLSAKPSSSADG